MLKIMGIFGRLEDVIKSYLNDEKDGAEEKRFQKRRYSDPDVEAAYQELNDYLKGDNETYAERFDREVHTQDRRNNDRPNPRSSPVEPQIPDSIKRDFAELGLSPGASQEECKAAYKKLLKIHHPDRHAGHSENMRKATEKSARINTAFDRIEHWRQTGKA
jgi:DnaJ-domain-containing protein 1